MLNNNEKKAKIALILKISDILKVSLEAERDESLKHPRFEGDEELLEQHYKKILTSIYRIRNNAAALLLRNNCGCSILDDKLLVLNVDDRICEFAIPTIKNILQTDFGRLIEKNSKDTAPSIQASEDTIQLDLKEDEPIKAAEESVAQMKPPANNVEKKIKNKPKQKPKLEPELIQTPMPIPKPASEPKPASGPIPVPAKKADHEEKDSPVTSPKKDHSFTKPAPLIEESDLNEEFDFSDDDFFLFDEPSEKAVENTSNEKIDKDETFFNDLSEDDSEDFWSFNDDVLTAADEEQSPLIESATKSKVDLSSEESKQLDQADMSFGYDEDDDFFAAGSFADLDPEPEPEVEVPFISKPTVESLSKPEPEPITDSDLDFFADFGEEIQTEKIQEKDTTEDFTNIDDFFDTTNTSDDDEDLFWADPIDSEDTIAETKKIDPEPSYDTEPEEITKPDAQSTNKFKINSLVPDPDPIGWEEPDSTEKESLVFQTDAVDLDPEEMIKMLQNKKSERERKQAEEQILEQMNQSVSGTVFNLETGKKGTGNIDTDEAANKIEKLAGGIIDTSKNDMIMDTKVGLTGVEKKTKEEFHIQTESDYTRSKNDFLLDQYKIRIKVYAKDGEYLKTDVAKLIVMPLKVPATGNALVTDIAVFMECNGESHVKAVSPGGKATIAIKSEEYIVFARGSWENGNFVSVISVIGIGKTIKFDFRKNEIRPESIKKCGIGHNVLYIDHITTAHVLPCYFKNNLFNGEYVDLIVVIVKDYGIDQDCETLYTNSNAEAEINGERYKFNLIGKWEEDTLKLKLSAKK